MIRFRLSRQALADLEGIWDYIGIAKSNPVAASRQVETIYETLTLLGTQPLLGEARDDLRRGLQSFSVGSYVILFYPLREGVEVAGIVHGAQDIEGMFRSGER